MQYQYEVNSTILLIQYLSARQFAEAPTRQTIQKVSVDHVE